MLRDVLARIGTVGSVDSGGDPAGEDGAEVGEVPLGSVEADDVDNVGFAKPDGDESLGELFYGCLVLAPCPVRPSVLVCSLLSLGSIL